MQTVYELFRHLHLEWALYTGILAAGLGRIFRSEGFFPRASFFVPGSMLTAALLMPLLNHIPFTPVFASQGSVIWPIYLLFLGNAALWLAVCFRGKVFSGLCYTLYYLLLIVLVKGALIPLYSVELSLSPALYMWLDIATILLLGAMLCLYSELFFRFRLIPVQGDEVNFYRLVFLIPFIFLITFSLFVSGNEVFRAYLQPILSGVLAMSLPLIYYNLASGSKAMADRSELETALLKTRADLAHFRGMIELEDRVRKERHELKNRYLRIRILLREKRLEELDRYLSEEVSARMDSLAEGPVGNTLVDYILRMKENEAREAGITFRLTVNLTRRTAIDDDLFCTILLNLLDNAIEGSRGEKEPEILVSLSNQGAYLILQVMNRISRNVLQINPALVTTKGDKHRHGHGVSIVRSAVREAGGILEIRTDQGYFDVKAALPDTAAGPVPGGEGRRSGSEAKTAASDARQSASEGYSTASEARQSASEGYSTTSEARQFVSEGQSTASEARQFISGAQTSASAAQNSVSADAERDYHA